MTTKINVSQYPDGRYCLDLMDADDRTQALFDERELQGGGYTWEGIVRSLIEMRMPDVLPDLIIGAEADNMYVFCSSHEPLEKVATLIRAAIDDQQLMVSAIEHGGEEIE